MHTPEMVEVAAQNTTNANVEQHIIAVDALKKRNLLESGVCIKSCASLRIGGEKVAEKSRVCRCLGNICMILRILDHVKQKNINLNKVEIVVLDEADRMLDMGFIDDIRKIMQMLPKQRQTLLFSANIGVGGVLRSHFNHFRRVHKILRKFADRR
jgi:superfamily II DNA/RNA helicase